MAECRPLEGRVALVTGASRGIGRAVAETLGAAGAAVAVGFASRADEAASVVAAIRAGGVASEAIGADLEDAAAAGGLVARVTEALGVPDIIVNNAGMTRDNLAVRMSDAEWADVIAVDLTAAFHICRAALKPLLRKRWGRIVNVASVSGVIGNAGQANYSAAKAGLIGLTKALAREVGSRGITVNAVAPGFIDTEMTAVLSGQMREGAVAAVPLQRMGTVDEVAAAVRFLCLPDAGYITGHVLHVDGGMAA